MRQSRGNPISNWRQHLRVVAAMLIAFVVLTPRQAVASCGDYVLIEGAEQGGHAGSSMGDAGQPGARPKSPVCRGAGCNPHQAPPFSPFSRITLDERLWGWNPEVVKGNSESREFSIPLTRAVCAVHLATSIFRPPRPVTGD